MRSTRLGAGGTSESQMCPFGHITQNKTEFVPNMGSRGPIRPRNAAISSARAWGVYTMCVHGVEPMTVAACGSGGCQMCILAPQKLGHRFM